MNKRLSIAIDDLALLRHMLNDSDFDPVQFAVMCEIAGAQGISMILAEDPRCLQERDAQLVKRVRKTFLNLRIPLEPQSVKIALTVHPDMVTFIELDKSAGISAMPVSVASLQDSLSGMLPDLRANNISVAVFCEPEVSAIKQLSRVQVDYVEFDCSDITRAADSNEELVGLDKLQSAAQVATKLGLGVNLTGGIEYQHLPMLAAVPKVEDICMGLNLVKRALWVGVDRAVQEAQQQILFYQRQI